MVFFDASEVFALLLLCPTLSGDKNYLFDDTDQRTRLLHLCKHYPMLATSSQVAVTK
jgi:hypothetical protein